METLSIPILFVLPLFDVSRLYAGHCYRTATKLILFLRKGRRALSGVPSHEHSMSIQFPDFNCRFGAAAALVQSAANVVLD